MNYEDKVPQCPIIFPEESQSSSGVTANNASLRTVNPAGLGPMYSEVEYGSYMVNPFTGYPVNAAVLDKSYVDSLMRIEEAKCKSVLEMNKQNLEHANRMALEERKAEHRLAYEDRHSENVMRRFYGMEEKKAEREHSVSSVFEDAEGCLCLETRYMNGDVFCSKPIINCFNMRAHRICDAETHETVVVIIAINDFTEQIILVGEDINPRLFDKCLSKRGIAVKASRERRKMVVDLMFAYLMEHATATELPNSVGWTKTNKGWFFTEFESKTTGGAARGYYEFG